MQGTGWRGVTSELACPVGNGAAWNHIVNVSAISMIIDHSRIFNLYCDITMNGTFFLINKITK